MICRNTVIALLATTAHSFAIASPMQAANAALRHCGPLAVESDRYAAELAQPALRPPVCLGEAHRKQGA